MYKAVLSLISVGLLVAQQLKPQSDPVSLLEKGRTYLRVGDPENAKAACSQALEEFLKKPAVERTPGERKQVQDARNCLAGVAEPSFRASAATLAKARTEPRGTAIATLTTLLANRHISAHTREQAIALMKELHERPAKLVTEGASKLASNPDLAKRLCETAKAEDPPNTEAAECVALAEAAVAKRAKLAEILQAEILLYNGKRAEGMNLAKAHVKDPDREVAEAATKVVTQSRNTWSRLLLDQLKSDWVFQTVAGLLVALSVLIFLFFVRWAWSNLRSLDCKKRRRNWTIQQIADPNDLGAADAIVDAIRRVPTEVKRPIFSPSSALIPPLEFNRSPLGLWENLWQRPDAPKFDFKEPLDPVSINGDRRAQVALMTSLETAQLPAGALPVGMAVKLIHAFVDWFQSGGPTIGGAITSRSGNDGKSEIAIRLTASDRLFGGPTTTVVASTLSEPNTDTIAITCERAAYKLLHRLQYPDESPSIADGRSALRQGSHLLQTWRHPASGKEDVRIAGLNTACKNFSFASTVLREDNELYPLVLRGKALSEALLGDNVAALMTFQQIIDFDPEGIEGDSLTQLEALRCEARFNMGSILLRLGTYADLHAACVIFTKVLEVAKEDEGLRYSAHFGRLAAAGKIACADWPRTEPSLAQEVIESRCALEPLKTNLERDPSSCRIRSHIVSEMDRLYALALCRHSFSERGNRRIPQVDGDQRAQFEAALKGLEEYARQVQPAIELLVTLAHYELILGDFPMAEQIALDACDLPVSDAELADRQFAFYIAAEARFQNGRRDDAIKIADRWNPITEPAFRELRADLASPPKVPVPDRIPAALRLASTAGTV